MGRQTQYAVSLSKEDKTKLDKLSRDNEISARVSKRVHILLALNDKNKSGLSQRQIAAALNTTVTTIIATAKDYCEQGLAHALSHHFNPESVRTRKINGELEATVIQLACGKAPDGYDGWTLSLMTKEANKKGVAEPVSKETIRLMLKKMNLSLT